MALLFNSLEIMEILVDSGIEQKQSRAIVTAMETAIDGDTIATKAQVDAMEISLKRHMELMITKQVIAFGSLNLVAVGLMTAVMKFL